MAAVTLSTIESIECHATKKKWIIPDNLFEICEDEKFLQISASSYGLCNLLSHGTVGKNPSLKSSNGLTSLLLKRKEIMDQPEKDENEADTEVFSRKRKRASPLPLPASFKLDLGEYGELTVKRPTWSNDDLKVLYTENDMGVFCNYMLGVGAACVDPERRQYTSKKDKE